jgi:hypothetical protein
MSPVSQCRSGLTGNDGIATTVEYALLAGVSIVIFLALGTAVNVFSSTAEADATAIAAYRVASMISSSSCEIVGRGHIGRLRMICGAIYVCLTWSICRPTGDIASVFLGICIMPRSCCGQTI